MIAKQVNFPVHMVKPDITKNFSLLSSAFFYGGLIHNAYSSSSPVPRSIAEWNTRKYSFWGSPLTMSFRNWKDRRTAYKPKDLLHLRLQKPFQSYTTRRPAVKLEMNAWIIVLAIVDAKGAILAWREARSNELEVSFPLTKDCRTWATKYTR